jgi:poly(hydroxyalkanoate) granule-associated protein
MRKENRKSIPESMADQVKAVVGRTQEETGKLKDALVQESEKLRDQTLKLASETVQEVKEQVEEVRGILGGVRGKATDTLDHLEQIFEDRVSRALKQLGVPTRDDLQGIAQRLEEINEQLGALVKDRQTTAMTTRAVEQDDLKLINGIGPVLEGKLNTAGICSYRQIALLTDADIDHLESEIIHFSGRIRRDEWVAQAREFHARKYGEAL